MRKMSFASKSLVLFLSIFAVQGADKNAAPGPTESYPSRQTQEKVTIAVQPFDTQEKTRLAFDKVDPNRYGILPVLVIIRNDGPDTLMLEGLRVEYITESRQKVEAIPSREVAKVNAPGRPRMPGGPLPTQIPRSSEKNPLTNWAIRPRICAKASRRNRRADSSASARHSPALRHLRPRSITAAGTVLLQSPGRAPNLLVRRRFRLPPLPSPALPRPEPGPPAQSPLV
jgi:hypothetical protein